MKGESSKISMLPEWANLIYKPLIVDPSINESHPLYPMTIEGMIHSEWGFNNTHPVSELSKWSL